MANERINRIKKAKKPLKKILLQLLKKLVYLILILSIAGLIYLFDKSNLLEPKISWEINGNLTTQAYQYDKLIESLIGNKYLISLAKLKNKLEASPWAKEISIQRVFWNTIRITIKNHDIAMRWGINGYISSNGVLFKPNISIISNKPIAIVSEDKVGQFYIDFINYQSILNPMKITQFERSNIDQLTLENNIKIILGYQKQTERLVLFNKVYESLKKYKKNRTRGGYDMRYPRGFALSYLPL